MWYNTSQKESMHFWLGVIIILIFSQSLERVIHTSDDDKRIWFIRRVQPPHEFVPADKYDENFVEQEPLGAQTYDDLIYPKKSLAEPDFTADEISQLSWSFFSTLSMTALQ